MKKCAEAKKKNCRQTRKRKEEGFFDHPFFCPFLSKSKSSSKRARFFLRFFVFLSSRSEYSFVALLVGRARARVYISRNARSRRVSLERRDEKKREKERKRRARETTIPEEKGKRKKERSNRFFGAVVCVRASEDERKRGRKRDFPLLFERFSKGALRAEFLFSHSLSLTLVRSCL